MTSPRPAENRDDSVIPVSIVPQWGNGIPQPLTPLVGRQEQIVYVTNLLLREEARLLTLTGPGGTGKSRLAIEIARNLAREEALEVIFVSLGSIREPNLLPSTLAHDLGIRDIASDHALHSLQRVFRARPVLLVLDTFEHLLQAAPFLASLLTTCPDLRILVTSRAALRLGGEHVVAVPPLSLPPPGPCTPEVLATSEAGQLYAVHARMVDPGFSVTTETAPVIATICQRLDGLPLAIELAAARSRTLTPQQLLARLPRGLELLDTNRQDLTGHQRAVQSTIAWSYDLLTPECQRVFHHLGVFSNGFPLDAALAIHGDLPEMTVLDALESLLDNSLLQRTMRPDGELRFFMLETIRMFALDRLARSPDNAAAHVSHVEWAVALAEQTPLGLMGDADRHVYARLEREHDNLRSAMQWSLQHGNPEHCLRIANAIWSFWQHRGYLAEGSDWLDRSLRACAGSPVQLRARALLGRAFLAYSQDDLATSHAYASQSLAMYRDIDRPVGIGFCLLCLSLVAEARGDLHPAIGYLTTALSLFRQEHRSFFEAHTIMTLGRLHFSLNDLPRAATQYREALALQRSIGNQMSTALTLDALGELSIESGNLPEAFSHFKQGRDIWRQLDHPWGLAESIAGIGLIAAHLGMWETAARLTGSAIARFASIQAQLTPVSRRTVARTMVSVRAGLGSVDALTYRDSGKTLPIDEIDRQISAVEDHLWNRSASSAPSAQAPFLSTASLTARESDVLDLLIQGHSNRAIADALFISVPTVKVHITHILDKLQLPSRAAVIAHVLGSGNETGTTRD